MAYSGSRLISSLCWVFHQHAGQEDVLTMINKVNDHMTCGKDKGVNSDTGNPEETQRQLPSWLVETTRKFYLVKVIPASDRSQADMQDELQCSLASLGCFFTSNETRELASHYEDAADTHRRLCGELLQKYSRRKDELLKEKMENSKLRDELAKQTMEENSKLQDEIDSREK
uniref:CASPASE_P10 domain-containing protein n=1 Tax=Macrostomum lignano TaxID=282301 RepID=A0A1I8I2P8_9PLAT